MDKSIGKRIKRLRVKKGFTQKELAFAVGVSTPAVSKWERGLSLPDITLLAPLARCLGSTVDGLVGFTAGLSDSKAQQIFKKCTEEFEKSLENGLKCCMTFEKQYPKDPKLCFMLAGALQKYMFLAGDDEQAAKELIAETIRLFEISAATENEYRDTANGILISLYTMEGKLDKAELLAMEQPESMFCKNKVLVPILYRQGKDEQASKLNQTQLYQALFDALNSLINLASFARRQQRMEDAVYIYNKIIDMSGIFGLEVFSWQAAALEGLAEVYALLGDTEKSLEYLEIFVNKFPVSPTYDLSKNPLFDKIELSKESFIPNALRQVWKNQLEQNEVFSTVRKDKRFNKIIGQLE